MGDVNDAVFAQHRHKLFEGFPLFGFSDAKLLDEVNLGPSFPFPDTPLPLGLA